MRVFQFGQTDQTDRQKQVMIDARFVVYTSTASKQEMNISWLVLN